MEGHIQPPFTNGEVKTNLDKKKDASKFLQIMILLLLVLIAKMNIIFYNMNKQKEIYISLSWNKIETS